MNINLVFSKEANTKNRLLVEQADMKNIVL